MGGCQAIDIKIFHQIKGAPGVQLRVDIVAAVVQNGRQLQHQAVIDRQAVDCFVLSKILTANFRTSIRMAGRAAIFFGNGLGAGNGAVAYMLMVLLHTFGNEHMPHHTVPQIHHRKREILRFGKAHQPAENRKG